MPGWVLDLLRVIGDLGVGIVLLMLRAAAQARRTASTERQTLIANVGNAMAVLKEIQSWRIIVDQRLGDLEQRQADFDRQRASDKPSRSRRPN